MIEPECVTVTSWSLATDECSWQTMDLLWYRSTRGAQQQQLFLGWNLKPFDSFFVGSFQVSACLALWESEAHRQLVGMEMKRTSGTDWLLFCCFVVCLFVEPRLDVGATFQVLTNSITNNPLIVIHSSLPSHPNILIRNLTLNLIGGDREECGAGGRSW